MSLMNKLCELSLGFRQAMDLNSSELTVVVGLADDVLLHVVIAVLSFRVSHPSRKLAKKRAISLMHFCKSRNDFEPINNDLR